MFFFLNVYPLLKKTFECFKTGCSTCTKETIQTNHFPIFGPLNKNFLIYNQQLRNLRVNYDNILITVPGACTIFTFILLKIMPAFKY